MSFERISFLKNARLLLSARENTFNNFKSKIFSTESLESERKSESKVKPKTIKLLDFLEKIISNEININTEIFIKYFKSQNPTILLIELYHADKTENKKFVNNVNNALTELRNQEIPNDENPKKAINIVEEIFNFK